MEINASEKGNKNTTDASTSAIVVPRIGLNKDMGNTSNDILVQTRMTGRWHADTEIEQTIIKDRERERDKPQRDQDSTLRTDDLQKQDQQPQIEKEGEIDATSEQQQKTLWNNLPTPRVMNASRTTLWPHH